MEKQSRAIILLQHIEAKEDFSFSSPIMTLLEQEKGQNDVLFSFDNLSDSLTSHYAKKLIDESENVLLICDLQKAERLGAHQPILNYCVKKKNVVMISLGETPLLKPFLTFLKGKVIDQPEEVRNHL